MKRAGLLHLLLLVAIGDCFASAYSTATPIARRPDFPKPATARFDAGIHDGSIVIKFREGLGVRLVGNSLHANEPDAVREVDGIINAFGSGVTLANEFSLPESVLAESTRRAEMSLGISVPDPATFFRIHPPRRTSPQALTRLADRLNLAPSIEVAYFSHKGVSPRDDIAPPTPNYEGQQHYLDAAPIGVDARYAWTKAGGRGESTKFIDLEYGWTLTHEDLKDPFVAPFGSTQCTVDLCNHGTAVLGIVIGQENGFGVTGIAHQSDFTVANSNGSNHASSIASAAEMLSPGDALLVELAIYSNLSLPVSTCGPPGSTPSQYGWVPLEDEPAVLLLFASQLRTESSSSRRRGMGEIRSTTRHSVENSIDRVQILWTRAPFWSERARPASLPITIPTLPSAHRPSAHGWT